MNSFFPIFWPKKLVTMIFLTFQSNRVTFAAYLGSNEAFPVQSGGKSGIYRKNNQYFFFWSVRGVKIWPQMVLLGRG